MRPLASREDGVQFASRPAVISSLIQVQRICHAVRQLLENLNQLRAGHLGNIDVHIGHVGGGGDAPLFNFAEQVNRCLGW